VKLPGDSRQGFPGISRFSRDSPGISWGRMD
jgi:hypothetical protein